jgi:hypothetical protein
MCRALLCAICCTFCSALNGSFEGTLSALSRFLAGMFGLGLGDGRRTGVLFAHYILVRGGAVVCSQSSAVSANCALSQQSGNLSRSTAAAETAWQTSAR